MSIKGFAPDTNSNKQNQFTLKMFSSTTITVAHDEIVIVRQSSPIGRPVVRVIQPGLLGGPGRGPQGGRGYE